MASCIHRIDGQKCGAPRYESSSKLSVALCLKHKSEVAKLRRLKFRDNMIKTEDPDFLKMKTLIFNAASALRMQTSRRIRVEALREIDEPNVLRIATILDTMKNSKDYVIIDSAIADTLG